MEGEGGGGYDNDFHHNGTNINKGEGGNLMEVVGVSCWVWGGGGTIYDNTEC